MRGLKTEEAGGGAAPGGGGGKTPTGTFRKGAKGAGGIEAPMTHPHGLLPGDTLSYFLGPLGRPLAGYSGGPLAPTPGPFNAVSGLLMAFPGLSSG